MILSRQILARLDFRSNDFPDTAKWMGCTAGWGSHEAQSIALRLCRGFFQWKAYDSHGLSFGYWKPVQAFDFIPKSDGRLI